MRTISELIAELDEIATTAEHVAIVLGFETTTIFVWNDNINRLSNLAEAVKAGGMPLGFIAILSAVGSGELGMLSARPLRELSGEEWAEKLFKRLLEEAAKRINFLRQT